MQEEPETTVPHPESRLGKWVETVRVRHGHRLQVVLTQNRRILISYKPAGRKTTALRLHKSFEQAPEPTLEDLTLSIVRRDREAWSRVRRYVSSLPNSPEEAAALRNRRPTIRTRGEHHDLAAILKQVKARYFPDVKADISWGTRGESSKRWRRSIRFGTWSEDLNLIRIHPVLDAEWVPREFLRYLVYHELCHAVAKPTDAGTGKRQVHHREFKELEARYPRFEEMENLSQELFNKIRRMGL